MTEQSDLNNSLSCISVADDAANTRTNTDKAEIKTYPIRCSNCSNISILKADFKKNYYCTICDKGHKNEYNSFSSFLLGANKDLSKMLCHECQKSTEEIRLYKCHNCDLFYCEDCKGIHSEKNNHDYFQEINKFDGICPVDNEKFKYFNIEKKSHFCEICFNNNKNNNNKRNNIELEKIIGNKDGIEREYNKVKENMTICNSIQKIMNDWLNELTNKVKNYCETLNNYYWVQNSILFFLNNDDLYNYNYNALINYKTFKNKNNIDLYIQQINTKINSFYKRDTNLVKMSDNFIQLLNDFNDVNFVINSENTKNFYSGKSQKNGGEALEGQKKPPKLEKMSRKKIDFGSEIKCFSELNEDKNLILGFKDGRVQICEMAEKEIKSQLLINEFSDEIKSIKALDTNLLAVTDGSSKIKIIELESGKNSMKYKVIQNLYMKSDSENIYCMTYLPNLSKAKKRHYLCTGDESHILIWKSNKVPKYLKFTEEIYADDTSGSENSDEETKEDETPLQFTLVKDIQLNTLTRSIIEVNDKYLVAACTGKKTIKIFDIENDFEEIKSFKNIPITSGSSILTFFPEKEAIICGCTDGFRIITTKNFEMKRVHCKYMVTSLMTFGNKYILNCGICKNESKIRQYKLDEFYQYSKSSEKDLHGNEVWNFRVINNKVFYSNKNYLYFLE